MRLKALIERLSALDPDHFDVFVLVDGPDLEILLAPQDEAATRQVEAVFTTFFDRKEEIET